MRRNWVLNKRHYPPHASRLSPAQVLEDKHCICRYPTGVEAAARLATTAANRLLDEDGKYALLAACADSGLGHACLLERWEPHA